MRRRHWNWGIIGFISQINRKRCNIYSKKPRDCWENIRHIRLIKRLQEDFEWTQTPN